MGARASQITSLTIVYSIVYSDADQRKHESSASLAFVQGIHRWPVNSPQKLASNAENVSIWWRHHGCRTGDAVRVETSCLRHRIETLSVLLALCEENAPVTVGFLSQRPVTQSFDVLFDLHLNKQLSKQANSQHERKPDIVFEAKIILSRSLNKYLWNISALANKRWVIYTTVSHLPLDLYIDFFMSL